MKITGLGPTMGVQSTPDHDEQELEISGLLSDDAAPVEDLGNAADSSEHQDTQEGLARLIDFIKAKNARRAAEKKGPKTSKSLALDAYHKISDGHEPPLGQNLKRRI